MKNGYYLSVYSCINKESYFYRIPARHDHNMALWRLDDNKLQLVKFWEFERITGLKRHDASFFSKEKAFKFINSLLKEFDLCIDDMVEVWGTPGLSTMIPSNKTNIALHSIYHLYSSLLMNTDIVKENIIISLALDAGPDNLEENDAYFSYFYAGAIVNHGKIELFDISSPACMWAQLASVTGMEEGSLMALATASKAKLMKNEFEIDFTIKKIADTYKASSYINELYSYVKLLSKDNIGCEVAEWDDSFSREENCISMAVKILQEESVRIVKREITHIIYKYGLNPKELILSISGGYGLNCPTNTELMNYYGFKDFCAIPCISDCGISLGIGLYHFYNSVENLDFNFKNSYYGNSDNQFEEIIPKYNKFIKNIGLFNDETFVQDIIAQPIVWFYGNAEIGPRALGHRSILGDPRNVRTKELLNVIKQRQWWRPVAPIIMKDKVDEWFYENYNSEYMLMTYNIKREKENDVPSILHIDGTARVQTVSEENAQLYHLLNIFYDKTGIPIICNTSLNDKGEPIIDSIVQLINFVLRKKIKIAYINGKRVEFHNFSEYKEKLPEARFNWYDIDICEKDINPFQLTEDEVEFYVYNPQLHLFDLTIEKDVLEVKNIIKRIWSLK